MTLMLSEIELSNGLDPKWLRDLLRKNHSFYTLEIDIENLRFYEVIIHRVTGMNVAEFLISLQSQGVLSDSNNVWQLTDYGVNIIRSVGGKRFSRDKADSLIRDIQERAFDYNLNGDLTIAPIDYVIVFGSYTKKSSELLGDLDVVVGSMPSAHLIAGERCRDTLVSTWHELMVHNPSSIDFRFMNESDIHKRVIKNRSARISVFTSLQRANIRAEDQIELVYPFSTLGQTRTITAKELPVVLNEFDRQREYDAAFNVVESILEFSSGYLGLDNRLAEDGLNNVRKEGNNSRYIDHLERYRTNNITFSS